MRYIKMSLLFVVVLAMGAGCGRSTKPVLKENMGTTGRIPRVDLRAMQPVQPQ